MGKPIVQDNNPRKTKFTFEEAVDVWLRRWSGQFQHEIAAAYVINPRAEVDRKAEFRPTVVRKGATLGANCTIVCGVTVGAYAFVAAGAVVTSDVPDHALVMGVPARPTGWRCRCGEPVSQADNGFDCRSCGRRYRLEANGGLVAAV